MSRLIVSASLVATILALTLAQGPARAAEDHKDHMGGVFDKCAKACATCMLHCESCFRHCATLVASGNKAHVPTMGTCRDCADLCGVAAKLAARKGPFSVLTCEACAKACDECGKKCEAFKDDKHMLACAKACRDCAAACREMIKHAGHMKE